MSQTKLQSLCEVLISTATGYMVAVGTQIAVFPLFGLETSLNDDLVIGGIFTIISIVRSFIVRRLFNCIHRHK